MPTYLWLDIGAIAVPFLFSFHPRLRFDKQWKYYIPAIFISMVVYVIWDVWFTKTGVWGFNPDYLVGIDIINLPLEEWLFFICIPYACLFTYHCLETLHPKFMLPKATVAYMGLGFIIVWATLAILNYDRVYSLVNFTWAIPVTLVAIRYHLETLSRFLSTYLLILAPFILINGMLTGALNPEPIVWYNDMENLGKRFFMPLEDYTYAYTMLLVPLMIMEHLRKGKALT